ncbi:PREDICTED: PRA1 family protein F3-like [Lupinus angustifolius]|uniref:PRA1 family protein F3-like n=1 Tax=Lupinus angustifolius TaxID=3871 RepID=UPI00092E933B|nr:PREDICTED: PRA1 family protein F3-like [Lupinus angustifolius]
MSSSPPHFSSLPSPSSSNSTVPYFILRASTTSAPSFPTRRPWEEVFALYSFTRPFSLNEAWERVRRNFTHFRVNYTMIDLFILFLSLLWHPISVIVFLVVLVAWCFLYFFRDVPVEVFHRTVDERVVVVSLSALTVVGLSLTGVSFNVYVAAMVGVAVCVVHAAFRSTEDLYAEENEGFCFGNCSCISCRVNYSFGQSICSMKKEEAWSTKNEDVMIHYYNDKNRPQEHAIGSYTLH